jgi:YidC/Oxa1 family membrane protein insertase
VKNKKVLRRVLMGIVFFFSAILISGCTKSFCSVSDQATLYSTYVETNKDTIKKNATSAGYLIPGDQFWTYIDNKVEEAYTASLNGTTTTQYAPASYIESNKKYNAATTESEKKGLVNNETLKAVIYYTGYNTNGKQELWANFNIWLAEANKDLTMQQYTPTSAYMTYYKSTISSGVGTAVTCLTPESGYYGLNGTTYVDGKTWGQAFQEYGFIEGLLVYPIGWLIYKFAVSFGVTASGGVTVVGQILSILFVTLIVRFFIVLASIGSNDSQTKMNEIQPELALLQAKYPNANSNKYEQQKLAQEQMALYKKNGIHPFKQFVVLLVQMPIFIAVWGALQGSAILTSGSIFNLSLSTVTLTAMKANTAETPFAIILFILMSIAQFFSSMIPMWIQKWHKNRVVGAKTVKANDESTTGMMMKYMPVIMMLVVIVMGLNLPAAMGIYWFFGAVISIFQAIITEIVQEFKKSRKPKNRDGGMTNRSGSFKSDAKKEKHMKLR